MGFWAELLDLVLNIRKCPKCDHRFEDSQCDEMPVLCTCPRCKHEWRE